MEISEFARQVLFGTSLEDKLHQPSSFSDKRPRVGAQIPTRPGRPAGLALSEGKHQATAFPTAQALAKPQARGVAFHFFANHELLALELMAVALLRFEDAPAAFRRQVATAMLEEQEHLAAYLKYMPGYGVAFGDVPVSPFFWNALANMASPLEYVAGMSLTFEQANLDFALRFRDAFAAVEDEVGAKVLQKVLDDEIGHVRLGVAWMRRLGDPSKSDFDQHRDALVWPLHMGRAKGDKIPRADVRKKAGLTQAYIDALACVRTSKGRAPTLWAFNPAYERELAGLSPGKDTALQADLGPLLAYLASTGDVVGVTRLPSQAHLQMIQSLGLADVEFASVPPWPAPWPQKALGPQKIAGFCTWGPSADAAKVFAAFSARSVTTLPNQAARQASARMSSKVQAGTMARAFVSQCEPSLRHKLLVGGQLCEDQASVERAVAQDPKQTWVLKAPYGSAGRAAQRIMGGQITEPQRGWIRRVLAQQGGLWVEPWGQRCLDLSARFRPGPQGHRVLTGLTRMLCDARGAFLGHVLTPLAKGLDPTRIAFLYGQGQDPKWVRKLYLQLERWLAQHPDFCAYPGPLGIDAMVQSNHGALGLRCMLEINARFTMGHVADALAQKVCRSACALWLHLGPSDLRAAKIESFAALSALLPSAVRKQGDLIEQGRLWTSDPNQAQGMATVLLVERDLTRALQLLGPLRARMQERIARGSGDFLINEAFAEGK